MQGFRATVAILCSGPSLTAEDASAVSHLRTYVTNSTIYMVPWADSIVGYDYAWWRDNIDRVLKIAPNSVRYSMLKTPRHWGVNCLRGWSDVAKCGNSGSLAVALAAIQGAKNILLLGADCSLKDGYHWHGEHPGLKNCLTVDRWPRHFAEAGKIAARNGCRIINCSRKTKLDCFQRMDLREAIDTFSVI